MRESEGPSKIATSTPPMRTFDAGQTIVVSASATAATRGAEGHGDPHTRHRKRGERARIVGQLRRRRAMHRQALHAGCDAEGGLHGSIGSQ